MAKDVDDALHKIIETQGNKSADEAAAYVAQMKKEKRYARDVY
jgi:sulfite reductase (NADPH) flavoprotein alpha-component